MPDSATPTVSIAITPMHETADGGWESGGREKAGFFLVELVQGDGTDAEVVLECKDERSAALVARAVAATVAALGLGSEGDSTGIEAFDDETAAILSANPTPEIALPAGEWDSDEEEPARNGSPPDGHA